MMKNKDISYEHNRWCNIRYTSDKETIQAATLKQKDATIPYCSKENFERFSCVFHIELNIRLPSTK